METEHTPTVLSAVEGYLAERAPNAKTKTSAEAAQLYSRATEELHRFARSIGHEKTVAQLKAPDAADYGAGEVRKGGDFEARLRPVKDFLAYLKKKGWHQDSLSVHVKIPRPAVPKGEKQTPTVGFQTVEVTESGLEAREKELADLKAQRPEIIAAIRTAAADKDYRENAPLDAAREEQGKVEARIRELEEEIRRAEVVETSGGSRAGVGATVSISALDGGATASYTLVDPVEANPSESKISVLSPVGKAVAGKSKGQTVKVETPKGERRYRIDAVSF